MSEAGSHTPLIDVEEVLLRQVHPDQMQASGIPDSSAFMAKQPHNYLLSTRRESVGARRAYEDWTEVHDSAGTYGMSVGEIQAQQLSAFDDSADEGMPEGHASVDFRGVSDGQSKKRARRLRDAAVTRGRLYPAAEVAQASPCGRTATQ